MPTFSGEMGMATIDVAAPSFKRLLGANSKLQPPIGASPGEMRLWLKINGLLEEPKKYASQRQFISALCVLRHAAFYHSRSRSIADSSAFRLH